MTNAIYHRLLRISAFIFCIISLCPTAHAKLPTLKGYITEIPPEPASVSKTRHERIAKLRARPVIMVHRGASSFAPENTLEAYNAAMDHGADGCEIDVRKTADGVLVLFHDDMLDHLTNGLGEVRHLTYYELLSLTPRFIYGLAGSDTRPPTLAALLTLARQRDMLLHLDVKEPGLEDEIAAFLDQADMWDHVVAVNMDNCPKLLKNPKLKMLTYKDMGLYDGRKDVDPEVVRASLAKPGEMIIVDDPRLAAHELKRPLKHPTPLSAKLRIGWKASINPSKPSEDFSPAAYLKGVAVKVNPKSDKALLAFLASRRSRTFPQDGDGSTQRKWTEYILERAWAAQRLGELGKNTPEVVEALEDLVRNRSLHTDWKYHGLDGAVAAMALAKLDSMNSVPILVKSFTSTSPDLEKVANPEWKQNPLSWTDWRIKSYIMLTLKDLRCDASKQFLKEYLAMDDAKAREMAIPAFEDAAKALLNHNLTKEETVSLLKSPRPGVRGTVILECLDHPTPDRTAALKEAAPWVLNL